MVEAPSQVRLTDTALACPRGRSTL